MNEKDKEVIAKKIYKKSEENRKLHFAFWVLFLAVFLDFFVFYSHIFKLSEKI